mgnify:CR=1 FL=1
MPRAITFDCYGTLVNMEKGGVDFLRSELKLNLDKAVELYNEWESRQFNYMQGNYRPYNEIVKESLSNLLRERSIAFSENIVEQFVASIDSWPLFEDIEILKKLKEDFKIGLLSNMDKSILERTAKRFPIKFDLILSSDDVKAFKPNKEMFNCAAKCLGLKPAEIAHCSFNWDYDIVPARVFGFKTVYLNRKGTKIVDEKPDATVATLGELLNIAYSI